MLISAWKMQRSIVVRCTLCVAMVTLLLFLTGCDTLFTPTPTPTPPATWNAIINSTSTGTTYTDPQDPSNQCTADYGSMYLAIDISFANESNQTQVLNDSQLDLQDSSGGHYQESQCAGPSNQWAVDPGHSIEVIAVFLVPSTSNCFTLSILDDQHNVDGSWSIGNC